MNFFTELKYSLKENPKSSILFNNIFSFREFGNKTHGDMSEVLLDHYINKYLKKFRSQHIGKTRFRAKESEEDLVIEERKTGKRIFLSLKNYGDRGPLQIRTDKENQLFSLLSGFIRKKQKIECKDVLPTLKELLNINVLCFLYNEGNNTFRVGVIKTDFMIHNLNAIIRVEAGGRRKHPIYEFLDGNQEYMFEVRYGGTTANALQRGIWTNTSKVNSILDILFEGSYTVNQEFLTAVKELSLLGNRQLKDFLKRYGC